MTLFNEENSASNEELFSELERSPELENVLVKSINDGDTPVAVGYTSVYLKGSRRQHRFTPGTNYVEGNGSNSV